MVLPPVNTFSSESFNGIIEREGKRREEKKRLGLETKNA